MPSSIVRLFRARLFPLRAALVAAALMLPWSPSAAGADEHADLQAAFRLATAQYQVALKTLETRGREETAAEVSHLRAAFQAVIQQFNANRATRGSDLGSDLGGDQDYAGALMQLDVSIIGVLLVIDFGSREAAREALLPIGRSLAELGARATPRE
jgi:hypothetical protein